MPPPNGSDSERLMAQIEAYLRTGEGPPAAPEPGPPRAVRTTRPFEPDHADAAFGGSSGGWSGRSAHPSRDSRRKRLSERLTVHLPSFPEPGPGPSGESPRWTPVRAVLVVAFVVGLLLIPVIWPSRAAAPNQGGTDHASATPAGAGYSFLRANRSGTPVRWDPCTPIQYQLDLDAAPPWAEADIASAMERMSAATGIQFVPDGTTNQFPTSQIPPGSTSSEPPVVIAWATAQESQALDLVPSLTDPGPGAPAPDADSLAQTVPVASHDQVAGHMVYVTGSVVIGSAAAQLPAGFGPGGEGILMLHELGRLLGLGEVPDGRQVMSPQVLAAGLTALGPGDRAGLKRLGVASGCLKVPANAPLERVL